MEGFILSLPADDIDQVLQEVYQNKTIKSDLIWENGVPNLQVGSISFILPNTQQYTAFLVICALRAKASSTANVARSAVGGVIEKDKGGKICVLTGTTWACRNADAQTVSNGVRFSFSTCSLYDCRSATLLTNYNDYCIPYRIYGIKAEVGQ